MFMADGTTATWTDEAGILHGYCVGCGDPVSTHPDDCAGGLAYCGDCGGITCAACREDSLAGRCPACQAKNAVRYQVTSQGEHELMFVSWTTAKNGKQIACYTRARVQTFESEAQAQALARKARRSVVSIVQ